MATPACLAAGWGWSAAYYQDLLTVSFGPERAISPVQPVIIRVIRPTSLSAAPSCIRVNIRVIIRVMLLTSCHLCIIRVSWTLGTHMTLATSLLSTSQQIGEYGEGTGAGGLGCMYCYWPWPYSIQIIVWVQHDSSMVVIMKCHINWISSRKS